jgi:TRAP-type C4-dicarboxylate transport system permease small subunit
VVAASIAARAHRAASSIAAFLAVLGAVILLGAAVIITYSVLLRAFADGQVLGDFEIMSVASGIAILLFLPYCQATRAHVLIEVFTSWLPAAALRFLHGLWSLGLAAAAALLTWRLMLGLEQAWMRGDVTMMRHIPMAIVFAAAVIGVAGTALLALLEFVRDFSGDRAADGNRR